MYSGVARSSYRQHCWSGRGGLSHEVRTGTPQRERSGIGRGTPQSANQLTDWRRRRRRRRRKEITYERIGIHLFQKCLNVRQKLGTRNVLKLSLSHSISFYMLNNFCFHVYVEKSHSHTLTLSHSLSLDMLNHLWFSCLGSKVTVYSRKLQCFF